MIYYSGIFCGSHYEIHKHDIIAVDFDGVLFKTFAPYDPRKIGDPIWPMIKRVKKWIAQGKKVVILTARMHSSHTPEQLKYTKQLIEAACKKYLGKKLPVTAEKHSRMSVMYDDRAIQVRRDTGTLVR